MNAIWHTNNDVIFPIEKYRFFVNTYGFDDERARQHMAKG